MKKIIKISLFLLVLSACKNSADSASTPTETTIPDVVSLNETQIKNVGLQLGTTEIQKVSALLKVNGKIDVPPQNMVSISAPLGGYLKSTQLLPGSHVIRGEAIATIEDQQFIQLQQDYLTAQSKLTFMEYEFARQKELNQSKSSSDKVFQLAESDYKTQRVLVKALAEKLRLINVNPEKLNENNISRTTNIYSPIDGFVAKVEVNIGKYVNPSDVLFELVNPTDIHLNLMVFEKDMDKLFIGQQLQAYTNSEPDKKYDCEIILISRNVSEQNSVEVHCHFKNYDKKLIPGMYMNAQIKSVETSANVLPNEAIVQHQGKQYVFSSNDGKQFFMDEVKAETLENGFSTIDTTTKFRGKQFVVKGAYALLMQLKNGSDE